MCKSWRLIEGSFLSSSRPLTFSSNSGAASDYKSRVYIFKKQNKREKCVTWWLVKNRRTNKETYKLNGVFYISRLDRMTSVSQRPTLAFFFLFFFAIYRRTRRQQKLCDFLFLLFFFFFFFASPNWKREEKWLYGWPMKLKKNTRENVQQHSTAQHRAMCCICAISAYHLSAPSRRPVPFHRVCQNGHALARDAEISWCYTLAATLCAAIL